MPIYPIAYLATLIICCGYALARGGAPERWGAVIVIGGMVFANIAGLRSGRVLLATDTLFLIIDLAAFTALTHLACTANRFWPLWAAMIQLDAVFTHIVMYAYTTPPFSYGLALRMFAFPLPLLVGVGAWRYRARVRNLAD